VVFEPAIHQLVSAGMTYAFLYMGRYNLAVAKNALGALMSNEEFGLILPPALSPTRFPF